ncbi:MAG: hypothetical protein H0U82_05635 [Actinobacteria bacterium]|nr:hypothetical protein [Actinomycetota bacterium]
MSVLIVGAVLGSALVLLAGSAVAYRAQEPQAAMLEAAHLPPLLTAPGEPVELRYDVFCSTSEETDESPCDADGSVFVRTGGAGPFAQLQLRVEPSAMDGRYVALVPPSIARSGRGFSYYAVFVSEQAGQTLTLPAGGADAPQQSLPLDRAVEVHIGKHRFGAVRRADERVVRASWGSGAQEIGLEQGRGLPPTGGSSFDVDRFGAVHVLDQVHRRLLRWREGAAAAVEVPLAIDGTLADLSIADDGTVYVLETATAARGPLLRTFGSGGKTEGTAQIAERTASQVRIGSSGPVVLQHPSGQWMPAAIDGRPLSPQAQKRAGRAGRAVPGVGDVVVLRVGSEIRSAVADANGVRRAWRVTSDTPLAEIQLAEPLGNRLVLVVRAYTDDNDEFVALVLGPTGLLSSFALDSADWAETAPLSRFRLAGSALYQLGSTPAGLFVDRFELEVK